ncbi:MAG TPA: YciI family protein [Blastocatellia bacterium]|nr:YciI family protein [Blastocatellia bacterium]
MRIMGLLKADKESEAGVPPTRELMAEMGTFIEEIMKAGVLVATDGLQPSSKGARVKVSEGKVTVIDGPFTESKELVASYALLEVKSMAEAIEWTTRFLKVLGGGQCELRPIFEATDFPPELFPPEEAAREEAWRKEMQKKNTAKQ